MVPKNKNSPAKPVASASTMEEVENNIMIMVERDSPVNTNEGLEVKIKGVKRY